MISSHPLTSRSATLRPRAAATPLRASRRPLRVAAVIESHEQNKALKKEVAQRWNRVQNTPEHKARNLSKRDRTADEQLAVDDTRRWCVDRCMETGHCEVAEDLLNMTTDEVMEFCQHCASSEKCELTYEKAEKYVDRLGQAAMERASALEKIQALKQDAASGSNRSGDASVHADDRLPLLRSVGPLRVVVANQREPTNRGVKTEAGGTKKMKASGTQKGKATTPGKAAGPSSTPTISALVGIVVGAGAAMILMAPSTDEGLRTQLTAAEEQIEVRKVELITLQKSKEDELAALEQSKLVAITALQGELAKTEDDLDFFKAEYQAEVASTKITVEAIQAADAKKADELLLRAEKAALLCSKQIKAPAPAPVQK